MYRTPDKMELTSFIFGEVEREPRSLSNRRAPQTDRINTSKEKVKSPLMLMLLLQKKTKTRVEQAFLRIRLHKNKYNQQIIVGKYLGAILETKMKLNRCFALNKMKGTMKRKRNFCKFVSVLNAWFQEKTTRNKGIFFLQSYKMKYSNLENNLKEKIEIREPKFLTTNKKNEMNRSLDSTMKSQSASKIIQSKRLGFDKEDQSEQDINALKKENESLRLMELSEEAREALKKVQRFDRFFYAQETDKACREVLANEIKRLEKLKNSKKEMRGEYYDNELTITALHNHIKLIHELNRDIGDLSKYKEDFEKQEIMRKEEEQRMNIESKKNKVKMNTENQIKQMFESLESNLINKNYDKVKMEITNLINRFEKEDIVKDKLVLLKSIQENVAANRDMEKRLEDLCKISNNLVNFDYENKESLKILKNYQREITQLKNKYSKEEKSYEVFSFNVLSSMELIAQTIQQKIDPINGDQSQKNKFEEEIKKLQKEIEKNKTTLNELLSVKMEFDKTNKLIKEFEKRVSFISQKIENKQEIKRDLQNLQKDKLFLNEKPFCEFFIYQGYTENILKEDYSKEIDMLSQFIQQATTTFGKEKLKPEVKSKEVERNSQMFLKKLPHYELITQGVSNLIEAILTLNGQTTNEKEKMLTSHSSISEGRPIERRQRLQSEESRPLRSNQMETEKERIEKDKLVKEVNEHRKLTQTNEIFEKKLENVISRMKKNEDWMTEFELLKRDKTFTQNKSFQSTISFYDSIVLEIKKEKGTTENICSFVNSLEKICEKKLGQEKESLELENLRNQTIKLDHNLEEISDLLLKFVKSFSESNTVLNPKDTRIRELTTENKRLNSSIENERSKSKDLNEKVKEIERTNKEQSEKLISLEKQAKTFKERRQEITKSREETEVKKEVIVIGANGSALETINRIEKELSRKDFVSNEEFWSRLEKAIRSEDKVIKTVLKCLESVSDVWKAKNSDERKLNEKTIKSYENELEKMNKIIAQTEIQIKEKDKEHEELYKNLLEVQHHDDRKNNSLRASRKSFRSNSSDKNSESKSLKASLQNYAEQEKHMLSKLSKSENEKHILLIKNSQLESEISIRDGIIEDSKSTIQMLEESLENEHECYQKEYEIWKNKSIDYSNEINGLRSQCEREFSTKERKIRESFERILKEREEDLERYHNNLENVQNELNKEVNILKDQIKEKNLEINQFQENQSNASIVELKKLKQEIAENENLRMQVFEYVSKIREKDQQIEILKRDITTQKADYDKKVSLLSTTIPKLEAKITELETKVSQPQIQPTSNPLIEELENKISKLIADQDRLLESEVNMALKNQEAEVNKFLVTHDQEIHDHYWNIVIPQEKEKTRLEYNTSITNSNRKQNPNLSENNNEHLISSLKLQLENEQAKNKQNETLIRTFEEQSISVSKMKSEFNIQSTTIINLSLDKEHLQKNCQNLEQLIIKLESDISSLTAESEKYKHLIYEMETRNTLISKSGRSKTEADDNLCIPTSNQLINKKMLRISSENSECLSELTYTEGNKGSHLRKLLENVEHLNGYMEYLSGNGFEKKEVDFLEKINEEISSLVNANHHLQTKCLLLESNVLIGDKFSEKVQFFEHFFTCMDQFMEFLLDKKLIETTETYGKFIESSTPFLESQNQSAFFSTWMSFIKEVVSEITDKREEDLHQKAEEMIELKEQMNQILDKHIEYTEDENYETLAKYKLIFSDIKILLKEFLTTGNRECLEMIVRSFDGGDNTCLK